MSEKTAVNPAALSALSANLSNIGQTEIGTNSTSTASCASGTSTKVSDITLAAGTWIIVANAAWGGTSGTGYRQISIGDNATDPARAVSAVVMPINGKQCNQQVVRIVTLSASTSIGVYCLQNSGSTITCYPYVYAVRIK